MHRHILLAMIFTSMFLASCNKWTTRSTNSNYANYGWHTTYSTFCDQFILDISCGQRQNRRIVAIDCRNTRQEESHRVFAEIYNNRVTNFSLFNLSGNSFGYTNDTALRKIWQNSIIRTLPTKSWFKKLPQDVQQNAKLAISKAEEQYGSRSNY